MISFNFVHQEIRITKHAAIHAEERGIPPEFVKAAIKSGKKEKFGKNGIKFTKEYNDFTVICIGRIKDFKHINILTVEWKL